MVEGFKQANGGETKAPGMDDQTLADLEIEGFV